MSPLLRFRALGATLLCGLVVLSPAPLAAEELTLEYSTEQLNEMDLQSILNLMVVSPSRSAQRGMQAPAVISVVTAETIRERGYQTLADILRATPGFYDVYDLVTHNVGVRGLNGGWQAGGSIVKVMIDSQPVDFRPTTENFFGPELIPVSAIERVEMIRGPGSALYGANAFLGVINIITKSSKGNSELLGRASMIGGRPGGSGELLLTADTDIVGLLVAVGLARQDRSGLTLPSTSPALRRSPALRDQESYQDLSRPRSLFAKAEIKKLPAGVLTLSASIQDLDRGGEFWGQVPLSRQTKIALRNDTLWGNYKLELGEFQLQALAFYRQAGVSGADRISIGSQDEIGERTMAMHGFGGAASARYRWAEIFELRVGADFERDDERILSMGKRRLTDVVNASGVVNSSRGSVTVGNGFDQRQRFDNTAVFGQGIVQVGTDWSAIVGGRLDVHSIYGANPSLRAGLVFAPEEKGFSLKLLYGSSFKAPSATQLFATPSVGGDIAGNPGLKAQRAQTFELVASSVIGESLGEAVVNLFFTDVSGRVEFLQRGLFRLAENIVGEKIVGGEVDTRWRVLEALTLSLGGGVAKVLKQDTGRALIGLVETEQALYPVLQVHGRADYRFLQDAVAGLEVSYISSRAASQSNAVLNDEAYTLPGYVYTAASASWTPRVGDYVLNLGLRADNFIDYRWSEPGFAGVDIPSLPIRVSLNAGVTF